VGIDTRGDIRNVILLYLAGCRRVITLSNYLGSDLRMPGAVATIVAFSRELRRWELNLRCAEPLGVKTPALEGPSFSHLEDAAHRQSQRIGIVPVAPWTGKWWQPEKWQALIVDLKQRNFEVVGLCGPGQLTASREQLADSVPVLENASVQDFANNLQQCTAIVTLDSGPMHLADALSMPVVALFGQGLLPLWSPSGQRSTVVTHQDDPGFRVAPPTEENTAFGQEAMNQIRVQEVIAALERVLVASPARTAPEVPIKIALSVLCENPHRRTGLTTTYHEFVSRSLKLYNNVRWVVFVGPDQPWSVNDPRVEVVRDYPANNRLAKRLFADHFLVPAEARRRGADVMISTGFTPIRKTLPTAMHVFSLQHLDKSNRVGAARGFYRHFVMTRTWRKADLVITNSRFAERQILSVFPEFQPRLVQAYEGLQHEQFQAQAGPAEAERMEKELNLKPGYFLWISNFYPYKQPRLMIEAYAGLDAALRKQHPLVMVGGDWENELAACKARAAELGVTEDVRFLGWVSDAWLAPLYRHAIAFCMASREETFGRSVIEAMACGTPVLVHDIPIMHEVTEGQALIADFTRPGPATKALRDLATNEDLRRRLSAGGLQRAQRFTFEKFTSERIDAIRRRLFEQSAPTMPAARS
jgi:glycosyltransferase involved in cell wall biosynthesis/ADP-heptose:LPS heptosyltransferase